MTYEEAQKLVARLREGCGEAGKDVPVAFDISNGNCNRIKVKGRVVSALTPPWMSEDKKLEAFCWAAGLPLPATIAEERPKTTAG